MELLQVHSGQAAAAPFLHQAEGGLAPKAGPAHNGRYKTRMDDIDVEEGELDEENDGTDPHINPQRWCAH